MNKVSEACRSAVKKIITILDTKVSTLIPNPKTKKIFYIAIGSLFGFMFLIIILGLILSPFRNQKQESILNIPQIERNLSI
jgi:hypothetical protein